MAILRAIQFLPGCLEYFQTSDISKKGQEAIKKLAWYSVKAKSPLRLPQHPDPSITYLANLLSRSDQPLINPFLAEQFEMLAFHFEHLKDRYVDDRKFQKTFRQALDIKNPSFGIHGAGNRNARSQSQSRMSFLHQEYRDFLEILWAPAAIARVHRSLLEVLLCKQLDINAKSWKILIIEQDIPCAHLAIESFKYHLQALFKLEGQQRQVPEIELEVIGNPSFEDALLRQGYPVQSASAFSSGQTFDLIIDQGFLLEAGDSILIYHAKSKERIVLRSVLKRIKELAFYPIDHSFVSLRDSSLSADRVEYFDQWLFPDHVKERVLLQVAPADGIPLFLGSNESDHYRGMLFQALANPGYTIWLMPDKKSVQAVSSFTASQGLDQVCTEVDSFKLPQKPWSGSQVILLNAEQSISSTVQALLDRIRKTDQGFQLMVQSAHRCSVFDPDYSLDFHLAVFHYLSMMKLEQEPFGQRLISCSLSTYDVYLDLSALFSLPFDSFLKTSIPSAPFRPQSISFPKVEASPNRSETLDQQLEDWAQEGASAQILDPNNETVLELDSDSDHLIYTQLPRAPISLIRPQIKRRDASVHVIHHLPGTHPDSSVNEMGEDHILNRRKIEKLGKGKLKEKHILEELFVQIKAPSFLEAENELTQSVLERFELPVRIQVAGLRLYVFVPDSIRGLGYIDLYHWKNQADNSSIDNAEEILDFMLDFFKANHKSAPAPLLAIREHFRLDPAPGILKLMKKHPRKKIPFQIQLPFTNDLDLKISDLLRFMFEKEALLYKIEITLQSDSIMELSLDENLFRKSIEKACFETTVPHDFIRLLNQFYESGLIAQHKKQKIFYKEYQVRINMPANSEVQAHIERILLEIRSQEDTKLAIIRLFETGILGHVEVNPGAQTYLIQFSHQNPDQLINAYFKRVQGALSPNQQRQLLESLIQVSDQQETLIRTIVEHWLDQYYGRIQPALLDQVLETSSLLMLPENGKTDFWRKQFTSYPLNEIGNRFQGSRILSTGRKIEDLWELMDQILQAPKYSLAVEFTHFHESVGVWKKKHPENELLILLEAFLRICDQPVSMGAASINETDELEPSILDLLLKGMIQYGLKNEIDNQKLVVYLDTYYSKVLSFDSSLEGVMEKASEYIVLVWYNRWLKDFKNKFISNSHDKG